MFCFGGEGHAAEYLVKDERCIEVGFKYVVDDELCELSLRKVAFKLNMP